MCARITRSLLDSVVRKHFYFTAKRYLLTGRSGQCDVSIVEVREQLKAVVGSPSLWGKDVARESWETLEVQSVSRLPRRRMLDSYKEAVIPLSSQPLTRDKYVSFFNTVRFGRILEDLDTMAVWISYAHNLGSDYTEKCPYSIVTALVDSIQMGTTTIRPDNDILLRGHASWVGNTSIEISMNADQRVSGEWIKLMDAKFLMVAKHPDPASKAYICPLELTSEEEHTLFTKGEESKQRRLQEMQESLLRAPPSEDERVIIHSLFLESLDQKAATFKHPVKPDGAVWMEDTLLKNVHICFPEKRNLYNKIFGGFLMRQSFEVAWTNACLYSHRRPAVVAVDDIMFRKPVEVGSLLFLSSQVVYTEGPFLQLKVHAEVVDMQTSQHETTNIFHYTFRVKEGDVPAVIPKSYSEYMMYVDGRRHFEASKVKL